jgi:hypothetical protein
MVGDLDQGELRIKRLLTDEFGIEGNDGLAAQSPSQLFHGGPGPPSGRFSPCWRDRGART